jgi:hypothetical protein
MRLQHARFPLRLDKPEDVRRISILAATGLVEAEFNTPPALKGAYVVPRIAVVKRITDDGSLKKFETTWFGEATK